MKKMYCTLIILMMCVAITNGEYNGECWIVSNGDTVYKLHANGAGDPNAIEGLTKASDVQVNPANGIVWIAVLASNAVFRYDPVAGAAGAADAFIQSPAIKAPTGISVNAADGTVWVACMDGVRKVSADGKSVLVEIIPPDGPANLEAGRFSVVVNPKDSSCWIADGKGPIARYDADGNKLADAPPMNEPKGGMSVDYQSNVWVADTQNHTLVRLSPEGEQLVKLEIRGPVSPSVNPKDGSVWVASNNNLLLNISAAGGTEKTFEVGMAIVAVSYSPAEEAIWIADLLGATFGGEVSKWTANGQQRFAIPVPAPSKVSIGFWEGN